MRVVRGQTTIGTDAGQSTVEAAFAVPLLFLTVLLLLQPALLLYDRMVMNAAAAETCRLLATSGAAGAGAAEAFARHRLASIPPHDCFHVHDGGCTWNIQLEGGEASSDVKVRISTEVRPLPLLDAAARLAGLANGRGNLVLAVEASSPTQPDWAFGTAAGGSPSSWPGVWLE